jgi:branched-chain amino acid aminotransferase
MRVAYLNGQFVPESQARVSIYDSGLLTGDMAYEVTRTIHQKPFRLSEHLERLAGSLRTLAIDPGISPADLERATLETLARNLPTEAADVDWQIIHNVSRGPGGGFQAAFSTDERRPTVIISCFPLTHRLGRLAGKYETGVDLLVPGQRAIPGGLLPTQVKARGRLHYQLANLEAEALSPGSWPVLLDPEGNVTEGTSFNLFAVASGKLCTAPEGDVLVGITRTVVLELARGIGLEIREGKLPLAVVERAEELFVTSTSIGILHARTLTDASAGQAALPRTIGSGAIGPVTLRLRKALDAALGLDFAAQAKGYAGR